jgi:hypothetical protein
MTTIQSIDQYKDILFYGFLAGIIYLIINIHNLIEFNHGRKRIITTKAGH